MKRRIFTALAAATIALGVSGCASMRMDRVAGDLRTALAGEPVIVTTKDDTLTMVSSADYLYPSGGWELRPGAPLLAKMVPTLAKLQNTNIIVSGYTDSTPIGPQLKRMGISTNKELSYNRAVAAVNFFASQGVNQSLLSAQGFGEADPVASNDSPEGRAKNRRIEITLRGSGS